MRRHDWPLRLLNLSLCIAVVAAFSFGCSERRSEGQKPVVVDEEDTPRTAPRAENTQVGEYEHVAQVQRYPGGIEPDDAKARKVVNQLYNYSLGACSANQECPADLEAAKEAIRKQFSIFWPKDPWGNPYQYKKLDAQSCEVWSFGPDGKDGTEDDVHISKNNREDVPH
ncbi:MAG: type II secretion system protein GspG [Proteobacteria bacterium]|nr:type II secretion system protein GspG [Pseudomonadota bacterium]MBQ9818051.1 type II secretion system protein GspG [Pseudomonadota bacterium]